MPMPAALLSPPPLAPGARVALVAPAGPLRDETDIERAVANARSLGWEPVVGAHVLARRGYLAGRDEERLGDLQRALDDPAIDGVWCLRGGYGVMRLLASLDVTALVARRKPVIGFSDITALHAALGRCAGLATYHGPTARGALSDFSRASLMRAVVQGGDPCGVANEGRTIVGGRARGRLVGGNLALLAALAGTPFAPDYDGAILVLEDVNEPAYRIDRMLTQLALSGALARCAGLVFGAFTEAPDDAPADDLDRLLDEVGARVGVPCIAGAPVGHIDDQWTLPLGALAELDADARRLVVER